MTVAEAWSFLTPRAILRRDTGFFPAAPYIDACEHTPEGSPDRARFIEAMWALVRDGDDTEQAIGTTFLSKFNIPDAILKEAVDLYVSRNLDMHSPLATIVNRKLPPDAFARLGG